MERKDLTLGERMQTRGVSRRAFLKYCATTASMLALLAATTASLSASTLATCATDWVMPVRGPRAARRVQA